MSYSDYTRRGGNVSYSDYTLGYAAGAHQQYLADQAAMSNLRSQRDDALDDSERRLFKLSAANKTIREKLATIAALQQSLDEATAKINSNTPDTFINYPVKRRTFAPQPGSIAVGDRVRYVGGKVHYVVEGMFKDNDDQIIFRIFALSGGGGRYSAYPRQLVKLS